MTCYNTLDKVHEAYMFFFLFDKGSFINFKIVTSR
jgi:hypothetical protein